MSEDEASSITEMNHYMVCLQSEIQMKTTSDFRCRTGNTSSTFECTSRYSENYESSRKDRFETLDTSASCSENKDDGVGWDENGALYTSSLNYRSEAPTSFHYGQRKCGGMISYRKSHMLPPCRICQHNASGLHYGVNTCEACKGFFRRSITRTKPYTCLGSGECVIGPGVRTLCSYCRFQKCLEVGMAIAAIKTGRYTYELKSKNIMEVKCLEELEKSGTVKDEKERLELDALILRAVEAQKHLHENIDRIFNRESLLKKQTDIHNKYKLKLKETGGVPPFTSLDEELRTRLTFQTLTDMEGTVRGIVRCAKILPGFASLSLEEQAALIKHSVFESWMISCSMCYNKDLQVFAEVMNTHVDEFTAMWGQDVADVTLKGMERLQNLEMTKDEMAVFRAMCITSTDREFHIKAKTQLEEMNWRYVQCLRYLTLKKGVKFEQRFSQIINAVLCMREGCEMFSNVAITKPKDWPELRENPIAYEVFFT